MQSSLCILQLNALLSSVVGNTVTKTVSTETTAEDWCFQVQCCFTSTETIKTVRNRERRTATSTFTQFLTSELVVIVYVALGIVIVYVALGIVIVYAVLGTVTV